MTLGHPLLHPTMRYPARHRKAGLALEAVGVMPDGRVVWPIMGAAPDDGSNGGQGGQGGGSSSDSGGGSGSGGSGSGGTQGGSSSSGNATDGQGNDLGFPANTPIAEMTDKQATAYWRNAARKHEGLWKGVAGDRDLSQVQNDLNELAELRKAQQTPAEQTLTAKYDEGVKTGAQSAYQTAAKAIFRGALAAGGVDGDDLNELVSNFNVASYVTDQGIDADKITGFARRFTPAGTANNNTGRPGRRDFGGGSRGNGGGGASGAAGSAEADKRFGAK